MEYYEGINNGEKYYCDRCNITPLRYDEYTNNHKLNNDTRFCDECTLYMMLRKFKCDICQSKGTMRNERLLPKICCEQEVTWLK